MYWCRVVLQRKNTNQLPPLVSVSRLAANQQQLAVKLTATGGREMASGDYFGAMATRMAQSLELRCGKGGARVPKNKEEKRSMPRAGRYTPCRSPMQHTGTPTPQEWGPNVRLQVNQITSKPG